MPTFTHTLSIRTTPERLWALISDVQRFAGLFSFTTIEEVQSPEPGCWLFWRRLAIPNIAQLRWREQAHITAGDAELRFRAVEGDLETFDGRWRVTPDGDGAQLSLSLDYAIPNGVNISLPPLLATYAMGEVFRSLCQRVKDVAEEDGP